jgi:hypothetical protein
LVFLFLPPATRSIPYNDTTQQQRQKKKSEASSIWGRKGGEGEALTMAAALGFLLRLAAAYLLRLRVGEAGGGGGGTYILSGERVARVLSCWAFGPVKWPFLVGLEEWVFVFSIPRLVLVVW